MLSDYTNLGIALFLRDNDGQNICNQWSGHALCQVFDSDGITGNEARSRCFKVDNEDDIGACIGTCDSGTDDTTLDNDCGPGYGCLDPIQPLYYTISDVEDPNCTDIADCTSGFECVELNTGQKCARPSRMCQEIINP